VPESAESLRNRFKRGLFPEITIVLLVGCGDWPHGNMDRITDELFVDVANHSAPKSVVKNLFERSTSICVLYYRIAADMDEVAGIIS